MTEFLETTIDKFTFKVATDRLYSSEGIWAKPAGNQVRIGLSDFVQQHSGDVAFVDVKELGAEVVFGDELATIETIKVNISLPSPATGRIIAVNPAASATPEVINLDPFGAGWLVEVEATDWEVDKTRLLDPQAYFAKMKQEAELAVKK